MTASPFTSETLHGLVGARLLDEHTIRAYCRVDKDLSTVDVPFRPWIVVRDQQLLDDLRVIPLWTLLDGPAPLRWIAAFDRWHDVWEAVQVLLRKENEERRHRVSQFTDLSDSFLFADPLVHWLMMSGQVFYRGLSQDEIVRVHLSFLSASRPGERSRADRTGDRILSIRAIASNGEQTSFRIKKNDEKSLLHTFLEWMCRIDPDVVAAYSARSEFLQYLFARCELLNIEPRCGRDHSELRLVSHPGSRPYIEIPGRTVFDPLEFSRALGGWLHRPMATSAASGPSTLAERPSLTPRQADSFVQSRCEEVRDNADQFFPILHSLAGIVSTPPENLVHSAVQHWFENAGLRSLLHSGQCVPSLPTSIPGPAIAEPEFRTGLYSPGAEIVVVPAKARAVVDAVERVGARQKNAIAVAVGLWQPALASDRTQPLTSAQLSLLNGAADAFSDRRSRFYDPVIAAHVRKRSKEIVEEVKLELEKFNCIVVQAHEDSLYCEIPDNLGGSWRDHPLWQKVASGLPKGLNASPVRLFDSLLSLGPHLLVGHGDKKLVPLLGAVAPPTYEPFLREYYVTLLEHALRQDWEGLHHRFVATVQRIRQRRWHVSEFARRETLSESVEDYERDVRDHRRNRSAAYEALRRAGRKSMAGSVASFYFALPGKEPTGEPPSDAAGDAESVQREAGSRRDGILAEQSKMVEEWDSSAPDEDTSYYLDRISLCTERFRVLFTSDVFRRIFSEEDLFGFSPSEVKIARLDSGTAGGSGGSPPDEGIRLDTTGST